MLVFDQFRADYLTRYWNKFLPTKDKNGKLGGFRYLMSEGAYFPFAEYDILQPMTGPGHSMILTGSYPYQSGIPTNDWFDAKLERQIYCVEDKDEKRSPRNLIGTTIGDELKNAGFSSRVVSIAVKDRAAILLGGHRADLALWFDSKSFQWGSSSFYLKNNPLPKWVSQLNDEMQTHQTILSGIKKNVEAAMAAQAVQSHADPALVSPYGSEITFAAGLKALDAYGLGQGKATDLLALSFSSHDYVGHTFGPNSLEIEQMTLAEDKMLSGFLNILNHKISGGLKNTVIVLTSDHGIVPHPKMLKGHIDAGTIDSKALVLSLEEHLNQKFGKKKNQNWITFESDLNFFLNKKLIQEKRLTLPIVMDEIKTVLSKSNGIAYVFSAIDYEKHELPPGMFNRKILKTYFPSRSGDVIAIPRPFYFSSENGEVDHMTGYSYDRTIPIIFYGHGIKRGVFSNHAEAVDIAPTLSFLTGTIPPSMSEGRVLTEALMVTNH